MEILKGTPTQIICIYVSVFLERFAHYGLRAILTLYLMNVLLYSPDTSTAIFHGLVFVAYTSPIIGSIIADGYIGKYWTIVYISCFYTVGHIVLAAVAVFPKESHLHPSIDLISITIVGLGAGGIKPCVSAFGADQFPVDDAKAISLFFSIFYFAINIGTALSSYVVPALRVQSCFDVDSCFSLAFGVQAAAIVLSVVIFLVGTRFYVRNPPKENIIAVVISVVTSAISNKFSSGKKRDHWLDHALDDHNCDFDERCNRIGSGDKNQCPREKLVEDVKGLCRVIVVFLPVVLYFGLYELQGSRWILQAILMDGDVTSSFSIYPDQMPVINAVLILILLPVFEAVIYPGLAKMGFRTTLLQRMAVGGFLSAATFIICGIVQLDIDTTLPDTPNETHAFVSVVNSFPISTCDFTVKLNGYGERRIDANNSLMDDKSQNVVQTFRVGEQLLTAKTFAFSSENSQCPQFEVTRVLDAGKYYLIVLTPAGWTVFESPFEKSQKGSGQFTLSVVHLIPCEKWAVGGSSNCSATGTYVPPVAICVKSSGEGNCKKTNEDFYTWSSNEVTKVTVHNYTTGAVVFDAAVFHPKDVMKGTLEIQYLKDPPNAQKPFLSAREPIKGVSFTKNRMGGVYVLTLTGTDTTYKTIASNVHTIAPDNTVSILWQLPACVVITLSEILFSISGLELAYKEASKELKSVVSAIWLLTSAIGQIIVLSVVKVNFGGLAIEFFAYGVAMAVVMVIFVLIASLYYEYRKEDDRANKYEESGDEPLPPSLLSALSQ